MKRLFFLFLFLFVGCFNKPVMIKPKPLPSWYLNPPKSSNEIVYVTGSGIDKEEAILNALNNFISRLSVTISSKFENRSESFSGGLFSKSSRYDIRAIVKEFEVSNYEVVKAIRYKFDEFLVLLKIDIKKLYKNLKIKLDNRFKNYKQKYFAILKEDPLHQLVNLRKFLDSLKKEERYIYALKVMNKNFNEKPYLNFIREVKERFYNLKNNLRMEIISNNETFAEDIKKYLTSHSIKIGKSDLKLFVKVFRRNSKSFMDLVVYNVYLETKYKNNVIGSNHFKIIIPKNGSLEGYLYDEIKSLSIEKFFNLN